MLIEAGTILQERYRIDRQIGQGGMGAVYAATDERFGSNVAIKQTLCMDDNYRRAIEREARLLNSLKHNALPSVRDHFVENDGQFLVMEFIPGEDLCCILEEQGKPFTPDTILEWADQLLDALEFLHGQKVPVVHRDIKPQNLKITPKGQIILLDFGLAKGNPAELNSKTAAKSIFGYSRNYASLEQIQGTGTDPRSDLYSLAATLYHLITGVTPADALTRAMEVLGQRKDPLIPPHQIDPGIPKGLSAILLAAMDLNAEMRPASAREMRSMLADHPRFADLADVDHVEASRPEPVFSQPTKIMPADTQSVDERSTEAKTQIMETSASELTQVRKKPFTEHERTDGRGSSLRPFAMAAGGLGAVLIALGVAAGVFMYVPERLSPLDPSAEPVSAPQVVADRSENRADEVTPDGARAIANATQDAAVSESQSSPDRSRAAATSEQKQIAKTTDTEPISPNARVIQTDEGPVIIDGDKIIVGDKKIVGNKVITPDGEFLLDRPVMPPPRFPRPGEVPKELNELSPEQRRILLRELRRLNSNVRNRRPPSPSKTPEP